MSSFELFSTIFQFIQAAKEHFTRKFTKRFDRRMQKLREALEKLDNALKTNPSDGGENGDEPVASENYLSKYDRIRDNAINNFQQILENQMEMSLLDYLQNNEALSKVINYASLEKSTDCFGVIITSFDSLSKDFTPFYNMVHDRLKAKKELLSAKQDEYIQLAKNVKAQRIEYEKVKQFRIFWIVY